LFTIGCHDGFGDCEAAIRSERGFNHLAVTWFEKVQRQPLKGEQGASIEQDDGEVFSGHTSQSIIAYLNSK